MLGVHAQTLRYYERAGVIEPSRSSGRIRLYSRADSIRIRQVQRLIDELGVNLAGADIIIKMSNRLRELEAENEALLRGAALPRHPRYPQRERTIMPPTGTYNDTATRLPPRESAA